MKNTSLNIRRAGGTSQKLETVELFVYTPETPVLQVDCLFLCVYLVSSSVYGFRTLLELDSVKNLQF